MVYPKVRIEDCNGRPTLYVNGEPLFLSAPYLQKAPYESFAEAGFNGSVFRTSIYGIVSYRRVRCRD